MRAGGFTISHVIMLHQERDCVVIKHSRLGKAKIPLSRFLSGGKIRYAGFTGTLENDTIRWSNGVYWSRSKEAVQKTSTIIRPLKSPLKQPPAPAVKCEEVSTLNAEPDDVRLEVQLELDPVSSVSHDSDS